MLHQTFSEQQNAMRAAAGMHSSQARRGWAALTAHATQHTRTHTRASTAATTTGYHRHPQPGTLTLSVRTTPDRTDPQPASTAALHTLPLSRSEPTANAPDRAREAPPRTPRTNAPAQKNMSTGTAQQEATPGRRRWRPDHREGHHLRDPIRRHPTHPPPHRRRNVARLVKANLQEAEAALQA